MLKFTEDLETAGEAVALIDGSALTGEEVVLIFTVYYWYTTTFLPQDRMAMVVEVIEVAV